MRATPAPEAHLFKPAYFGIALGFARQCRICYRLYSDPIHIKSHKEKPNATQNNG